MANNICKAFGVNLIKGNGEGSRGGVVIGHTPKGDPIYKHHFKNDGRHITVESQKETANELKRKLEEHGFKNVSSPSTSETNFGTSTYVGFDDEHGKHRKFRISDHDTGLERALNEYSFGHKTDFNELSNRVKKDIKETGEQISKRVEENKKDDEKRKGINEKWNKIKNDFEGMVFKQNNRTYDDLEKFSSNPNRSNIYQKKLDNGAYSYEWTEPNKNDGRGQDKPSDEFIENYKENK